MESFSCYFVTFLLVNMSKGEQQCEVVTVFLSKFSTHSLLRTGHNCHTDAGDLWSFRRHCMENRHPSIADITTWTKITVGNLCKALQYRVTFRNATWNFTVQKKPFVDLLWAWRLLGWTDAAEPCIVLRPISVPDLCWKKWTLCAPDQRPKGAFRLFPGKDHFHFYDGSINAEKFTEILQQHMLPSRPHLFQGHSCIFNKSTFWTRYKVMAQEEEGADKTLNKPR